jgi:hypothetical protein
MPIIQGKPFITIDASGRSTSISGLSKICRIATRGRNNIGDDKIHALRRFRLSYGDSPTMSGMDWPKGG